MGAYYFLACLLPPLPTELGEKMPAPFPELSRTVQRHIHHSDEDILRSHLSVIDAANWEQWEQGRDIFTEGGLLSREDMAQGRQFPEFIRAFNDEKERGIHRAYIYDRLWELCYSALLSQAEEAGCRYLTAYLPWEIALRNHLAALRFRRRDEERADSAVLPDVHRGDLTVLLSPLENQKNPLIAERYLDGVRLKRIFHDQGNDPFSLDAVLAFLSRAMIYDRWEKLQAPYDVDNILSGGGLSG